MNTSQRLVGFDPIQRWRRARRALSITLGVASVATLVAPACSSAPKDCDFRCVDGYCAEGFTCNAERWCVRPGSSAQCSVGGAGARGPDVSEAGDSFSGGQGGNTTGGASGGAPSGGAPSGGGKQSNESSGSGGEASEMVGGASGSGSGGEDAGGAGGGSSCEGELALELSAPTEYLCAEQESTLALVARGGTSPYEWRLLEPIEFELGHAEGAEIELVGRPFQAGEYEIRAAVRDGCGREATREFAIEVREPPALLPHTLPKGCARRLYETVLNLDPARRADSASHRELPLGLDIDPGTGVIAGALESAGEAEFELTLSNRCGASSASFTLGVHPSEACPIRARVSTFETLPPPCRDNPYRVDLDAGDTATFTVLEIPPGLELSKLTDTSARVAGVARGAGNLIVEAKGAGQQTVSGYPIDARDTCWFAYVANDEASKLHFIDAVLQPELGEPSAAQLGEAREAQRGGVSDFAFSSNGRLVAYSTRGAELRELMLLNLENWRERRVAFAGDVTRFGWSDAGVLAVAFTNSGGRYLAGLETSGIDWGADTDLTETFEPVPAQVDSPLTWIGSEFVAFSSSTSDSSEFVVQIARLAPSSSGFSPPAAGPEYARPTILPTDDGLFVTDWRAPNEIAPNTSNARLDFILPARNPQANPSVFEHRPNEIVAPGGDLTGSQGENVFDVFRATQDTWTQSPEPWLQIADCRKFLAWTRGHDRLACISDPRVPGESGELRLFEVDEDAVGSTLVPGTQGYSAVTAHESRRTFSPSGNWFAYATPDALFIADTRAAPSQPLRAIYDAPGAIDLEFSPDDRVLLAQFGGHAFVQAISLEALDVSPPFFATAEVASCVDDYVHAPSQWCGRLPSTTGFVWSPSGTIVAFRDAEGKLLVVDLARAAIGGTQTRLAVSSESFAFQPAPE